MAYPYGVADFVNRHGFEIDRAGADVALADNVVLRVVEADRGADKGDADKTEKSLGERARATINAVEP